jgi:hypothetical protein
MVAPFLELDPRAWKSLPSLPHTIGADGHDVNVL